MKGAVAPRGRGGRLQLGVVVAALIMWAVMSGTRRAAHPPLRPPTCNTSSPSGNAYAVTLCITAPDAGRHITGSTTVSSTISVTGTNPGVQELVFTLNGSAPAVGLPVALHVESWTPPGGWTGTTPSQVYAIMRDGFNTAQTTENLTFSNGITTPPVNNNTFTPSVGTTPAPGQPLVVAAVGDGASGQTIRE